MKPNEDHFAPKTSTWRTFRRVLETPVSLIP